MTHPSQYRLHSYACMGCRICTSAEHQLTWLEWKTSYCLDGLDKVQAFISNILLQEPEPLPVQYQTHAYWENRVMYSELLSV